MVIKWVKPGPPRRLRTVLDRLVGLHERPGEWGEIKQYRSRGSATATVSRLRKSVAGMSGRYEFATRAVDEGVAVYARWTPPSGPKGAA